MSLLKKITQGHLLFFAALFVLFSCQNDTKEIDEVTQKEAIFPTEHGKMVEIFYTDSGLVKVRLTAPIMNHYTYNVKEHYTEMPKGLFIEFFNEHSEIKTMLKANYGIRYEDTKKTEVKYKVQVTNVNGEVLNTEQLFWDEATQKIYTEEFVKITTKKEVLTGKGMVANQDFTDWEINNITGTHTAE
ncbi:MAG TPA: LPS export ABC transporter periplasmic protein LptC [Bacteroidia bacterium]|jgi:LPS export ABC transporter protein LptC|nr:LPS export ABC transporter periplasmic protein LptC [Bacteroidia bacterium]